MSIFRACNNIFRNINNYKTINYEQFEKSAEKVFENTIVTTGTIGAGLGAIILPICTYKNFKKENNTLGMVTTPVMIPVGAIGGATLGSGIVLLSPFIAAVGVIVAIDDLFK